VANKTELILHNAVKIFSGEIAPCFFLTVRRQNVHEKIFTLKFLKSTDKE
jgi:hypothetical protein